MQLQTLDLTSLHFPREEWKWLRPSVRFATDIKQAPDAFLWATRVAEKLWAWHPSGAGLNNDPAGLKSRVLVLDTDGTELEAHGLYLKTAFAWQKAHDTEWVAALAVLNLRLNHDIAQTLPPHWGSALESCGLAQHLGPLAQRGRYAFLSQAELQLLFDKGWDLATFELFETMSAELRTSLLAAVQHWNLSASMTKETANYVIMLSRKLGEKAALSMVNGKFKSVEEFRSGVMRMAQPELAHLSQKRLELLRGLHLPPRTSVFGDPSFEKDMLKLTHTPRNTGDFEAFKQWINDPALLVKVRELLEIYQ